MAQKAGVFIVIKPSSFALEKPILIAILANLLSSASIITLRKLARSENDTAILIYTNLATLVISGSLAVFHWQSPNMMDLFYLVGIGFSSTLSHYLYIQALKIAEPHFIAPFEYNRLVFAILGGYVFFNELPKSTVLCGALIIIVGNYYLSQSSSAEMT